MAVALVVFNGTRVDPLDTNTNTGHWVGSGGAPSAEAQNAYQNSVCVNKKTTATTLTGIDFDPGAGALDMTAAAHRLWFVKVYVTDAFSLNTTFGVSAGIGSALADHYKYNIAGSGAKLSVYDIYPAQGGYILTAIDPNIAAWRDGSGAGTPDLTIVDWFGVQCAFAATGSAKSENLAFDAIDVGTGLTVTAGDGVSSEGNFPSFVAADQDANTIRWGCVSGSGKNVNAWCLLTVGTASVTEFLDVDSIVTFKDGYHSAGLVGVAVGCSHASSIIQIDCTIIGDGSRNGVAANDTRPDFIVTGVLGTFDSAANLRNHRNITYTSICDVDGADIECELLTQASANISNSIIRTNALTSIACLQDPTFGVTTDLHDVEFIQTGVGHAIELDTATTYTLTNLIFTGYGADTTDDAALDITASSGTVTINLTNTPQPTYKTAGATVVFVASAIISLANIVSGSTLNLDGIFTTSVPSGTYNGTGDSVIQFTVSIPASFPASGDVRLWNGTYYDTYAYTGISGQQLTGVTPTLSQDYNTIKGLLPIITPKSVTLDPEDNSAPVNQQFEALIVKAGGTPEYKPELFEDNTSTGFSRRVSQTEDE